MSENIPSNVEQAKSLTEGVRLQRKALKQLLGEPMAELAQKCLNTGMNETELESLLVSALADFTYCKYLYVLNAQAIQITHNVTRKGLDSTYKGRDRSDRPYMQDIVGITDFKLSEAYISSRKRRPSLTAVQVIRDNKGELQGFLGADFDMRELPQTGEYYTQPDSWHQLKGDPAIRSGLFLQQRTDSAMDKKIDQALEAMRDLIAEHGVFHGKFHFSSNRATVWHSDDPFTYRLLSLDELISPDIFLAYPGRSYFERSQVPIDKIKPIFEMFKALRFADSNVYLRSGSLNIVNGMIGLNFSCDGSHYMNYNEFLEKSTSFWFGELGIS